MNGTCQSVDVLIDKNLQKEIAENRKMLVPIVDTIILLGRLGLAVRGHRDDLQYHPIVGEYSAGGVGNFIEVLNYRVRGGDKVLESHLNNCSKNATYISKTSQNELIQCCGQVIKEQLISEIKENTYYTILADEASDCSNKEQMSLVLRFVDANFDIREEFLGFLHCELGLSGRALSEIILKAISDLTVDIQNCRGQGYDGAGAVSGRVNGLSAHILRINKKAIYTHCHSHRLNLSVCNSCTVQCVKNVMLQIKEMSYFFNFSEPRQRILESCIEEHSPDSSKRKLKDVCRTRWIERIHGMDTFEDLFVPIVYCLENMSLNLEQKCNQDTSSKASSYLKLVTSFQFICALVISRCIFDMTLPVTQLLQSKSIDISDGVHLIRALKNLVTSARIAVDDYHSRWYNKALSLAETINVIEQKPRTVGRQIHRSNVPAENVSDYFKRTITIPLLDHLKNELKNRFDTSTITSYNGLVIVPSKMISLYYRSISWKEKFKSFSEFYKEDLPNPTALDGELELWEEYWVSYKGSPPDNISGTLKSIGFVGFENIKVSLRILGTLPVTSCECERSFSAMRRLKNYTRSTMVSERLNGLALLHVHQEIIPDINKVIDYFGGRNRRLKFV